MSFSTIPGYAVAMSRAAIIMANRPPIGGADDGHALRIHGIKSKREMSGR